MLPFQVVFRFSFSVMRGGSESQFKSGKLLTEALTGAWGGTLKGAVFRSENNVTSHKVPGLVSKVENLRWKRVKLKYGIILFILSPGGSKFTQICAMQILNLLQQERMCTHLRKACILEKSQDLNFINKQEGFLPSLGEPTGSALIHISRDHHRSRLFQDCKGLEETRRKHQLIKKINQEWVHGIRNELIQQRTQK